ESAALAPGGEWSAASHRAQDLVVLRVRIPAIGAKRGQTETMAEPWRAQVVGEARGQETWLHERPAVQVPVHLAGFPGVQAPALVIQREDTGEAIRCLGQTWASAGILRQWAVAVQRESPSSCEP